MYRYSRAIYRELAGHVIEDRAACGECSNQARVLRACEATMDRLATDRHYFRHPARTLFNDVRGYFPLCAQARVRAVVDCYVGWAEQFAASQPARGCDAYGNPLQCRATTRKGQACQRMPLPHNGYCPSHQHLAETETEALEHAAPARELAAA